MNYQYAPIRIAIADDHEIFREGFKLLLKNQPELELVGEAENGKELLELAALKQPDVVISDIKMPVMDGIEASRSIKKKFPEMQIIALSMFNEDNLIIDMLEAGAKGYLLKNTNKHELLAAVKAVFEGTTYYDAATNTKLAKLIAQSKFSPHRQAAPQKFTLRETTVIRLICQQQTNREIADQLGLSIRTVESHREKIQEKTGAKNSVGVVIYAIRNDMFKI
jgi:DNA-binding NarL/FixJ family response regulator